VIFALVISLLLVLLLMFSSSSSWLNKCNNYKCGSNQEFMRGNPVNNVLGNNCPPFSSDIYNYPSSYNNPQSADAYNYNGLDDHNLGNNIIIGQGNYYKEYSEANHDKIVVILHYIDSCVLCDKALSVWYDLKSEINNDRDYSSVILMENDETKSKTVGMVNYPTIIRYHKGRTELYEGDINDVKLRRFILRANYVNF